MVISRFDVPASNAPDLVAAWHGIHDDAFISIHRQVDPCPAEHPRVGWRRCGEWLLFSGAHDLVRLEQLEALEASLA